MTTLNDIKVSQQSDSKKANQQVEAEISMKAMKESQPSNTPAQQYVIFKLANTKRKGRIHIDGVDDVVNPETGIVERVRLISGVPSIWAKDQKHLTPEYVRMNRRSLTFDNRVLRIPLWDKTAIEFARLCRHYVDNPSKRIGSKTPFFEWNAAKQAEETLRKRNRKFEAMKKAFEADEEIMHKHALYLGVIFSDEMGLPKGPDAIRSDYVAKAELNPDAFLDSFKSPLVDLSFLIKKAIKDAKIDLGRKPNMAHWADGGVITSIPVHRNAVDCLVELAMTNSEEGKNFKNTLNVIMSK